jgi:hypothetical protein
MLHTNSDALLFCRNLQCRNLLQVSEYGPSCVPELSRSGTEACSFARDAKKGFINKTAQLKSFARGQSSRRRL